MEKILFAIPINRIFNYACQHVQPFMLHYILQHIKICIQAVSAKAAIWINDLCNFQFQYVHHISHNDLVF